MKDLLITHTDTDGISPIILLNLTGRKFEYKCLEISEIEAYFQELFQTDLSIYENIYVCDLSLTPNIYALINSHDYHFLVFDHHATHLFANEYDYVTVKVTIDERLTCATEVFYRYLREKYPILNKPNIAEYVEIVRQIDTFTHTNFIPLGIASYQSFIGKLDFIKLITRRLKKDKDHFELSTFEKRYIRLREEEIKRYIEKRETLMKRYRIKGYLCGVVFAEANKSALGNYLSKKYPELDLIIIFDASKSISYRTERDDVSVATFAQVYSGGGHQKASGSPFTDEDRESILKNYFHDIEAVNDTETTDEVIS